MLGIGREDKSRRTDEHDWDNVEEERYEIMTKNITDRTTPFNAVQSDKVDFGFIPGKRSTWFAMFEARTSKQPSPENQTYKNRPTTR